MRTMPALCRARSCGGPPSRYVGRCQAFEREKLSSDAPTLNSKTRFKKRAGRKRINPHFLGPGTMRAWDSCCQGLVAVDGAGVWVFIDFCESTVEGYGYSASRGATGRWRARVLSYRGAQQRAPSYIGNFGLGGQKGVAAGGSS